MSSFWDVSMVSPLRDTWLYELLAPGRTGAAPLLIGLAGGAAIGLSAYRKRSLTASGAAAAALLGTLLFALGSLFWFAALIAFFASSSALSHWKKHVRKAAEASYEKSGARDAGQAAANGLPGAVLCVLYALWPNPLWLAGFLGIMASVNADTWATEIGGLSRKSPRSILTGKPVPAGTSGGITLQGSLASAAGALFIGVCGAVCLYLVPEPALASTPANLAALAGLAWAGGLIGAFSDSLLGATLQRMYRCTSCGRIIESEEHCGKPAAFARGVIWMNNDAVNAISSLIGGAVAMLIGALVL